MNNGGQGGLFNGDPDHGHRGTVDSPPQNYYLGPPSESDHEVNGLGPMPWDKMSVRRPNGSSSVEAW